MPRGTYDRRFLTSCVPLPHGTLLLVSFREERRRVVGRCRNPLKKPIKKPNYVGIFIDADGLDLCDARLHAKLSSV